MCFPLSCCIHMGVATWVPSNRVVLSPENKPQQGDVQSVADPGEGGV